MMTEGIDYDICWNGVNDGHDSDYLIESRRVPDKMYPPPVRQHRDRPAALLILEVLPSTRLSAMNFGEVVVLTGLGKQTVNSALHLLRTHKRIASEAIEPNTRRSRSPQRYWRLA